jgi:ribose transport system substrate-binding protein
VTVSVWGARVKAWRIVMAAVLLGLLPAAARGAEPAPTRIGVVLGSLENPFWVAVFEGVRTESSRLGVRVSIRVPPNRADPSAQAAHLRALTQQRQDCYVVAPATATNLVPALRGVRRPLIVIDSPIDRTAARTAHLSIRTFIRTNDFEAGRLAGGRTASLLHSGGEVALIGGGKDNLSSELRLGGFKRGLRGSGVRVVERVNAGYDRIAAQIAAARILRAHPRLAGFFATNDMMALGISDAVGAVSGTGKLTIIGVDGIAETLEAVRSGVMSATPSRYPYVIGRMAVEACVAATRGAELPRSVNAPIELVTTANVDRASAAFPRPFRPYADPFARILRMRR